MDLGLEAGRTQPRLARIAAALVVGTFASTIANTLVTVPLARS